MNTPAIQDKLAQIRGWIVARKPEAASQCDDLDVDLIARGLIDSVAFVEYVLTIEDVSGIEIEVDEQIVDKVRTLRRVAENFL